MGSLFSHRTAARPASLATSFSLPTGDATYLYAKHIALLAITVVQDSHNRTMLVPSLYPVHAYAAQGHAAGSETETAEGVAA